MESYSPQLPICVQEDVDPVSKPQLATILPEIALQALVVNAQAFEKGTMIRISPIQNKKKLVLTFGTVRKEPIAISSDRGTC